MDITSNLQGFTETAAISVDAFKSIYGVALKATERIYSLNTDFTRAVIDGYAAGSNTLDYQDQLRIQLGQFERASAYLRDVSDILVATQAEVFTLGSANAEELTRRLAAEVEKRCLPSATDGNSAFSDALHSALSAATSTYETLIGTSRQITEASLEAVGQAGAKPVKKAA